MFGCFLQYELMTYLVLVPQERYAAAGFLAASARYTSLTPTSEPIWIHVRIEEDRARQGLQPITEIR